VYLAGTASLCPLCPFSPAGTSASPIWNRPLEQQGSAIRHGLCQARTLIFMTPSSLSCSPFVVDTLSPGPREEVNVWLKHLPECGTDTQFTGRWWHRCHEISPNWVACQECYLDVVSKTALEYKFTPTAAPDGDSAKAFSCQIYSQRMRGIYSQACQCMSNSFSIFAAAALERLSTTRRSIPNTRAELGVRTRLRSSCMVMSKQWCSRLSMTQ